MEGSALEPDKMYEEVCRILLSAIPDGIWIVQLQEPLLIRASEDGQVDHLIRHAVIRECNQAFVQMYGYRSQSEIEGMPLVEFLDRSESLSLQLVRQFLRGQCYLRNVETQALDGNDVRRYFVHSVMGIVESDKLFAIVGVQTEVTQQKLIQRERERFMIEVPSRQKAILQLMARGHSRSEVARALGISVKTVETHQARLMERLAVRRVAELLDYARRIGLGVPRDSKKSNLACSWDADSPP